jgi:predicted RNase H-like nuclease (RuvC/YqgF family)
MVIEGEEIINSAMEATKLVDKNLNELKVIIQNLTGKLNEKDQEIRVREAKIQELENARREKEAQIEKLVKELEISKDRVSKNEDEIRKLEKSNMEMKQELQGIQEQFSKISEMYRELSKKKEEAIGIRELLTIYVTLLEQVFAGMPHAKILWLLHGAKNTLKREELVKTSGVQPAVILKSIYDLQNANLVTYDMNSQNVTLIKKLY